MFVEETNYVVFSTDILREILAENNELVWFWRNEAPLLPSRSGITTADPSALPSIILTLSWVTRRTALLLYGWKMVPCRKFRNKRCLDNHARIGLRQSSMPP
jgi:hypothetical protein